MIECRWIVAIGIMAFLVSSCQTENLLQKGVSSLGSHDNLAAYQVICVLQREKDIYNAVKKLSDEYTLIYEYTELSVSGAYGLYYAIPYMDNSSTVKGCIIIPMDESLPDGQKRFDGMPGEPININERILKEEIPIGSRFLRSAQFVQWERNGLNVDKGLTLLGS